MNVWDDGFVAIGEWDRVLDKFREWETDPSLIADDDLVPPGTTTIRLATAVAEQGRVAGRPAPTRVMPNGEAGIVFEWSAGDFTTTWAIGEHHELEIAHHDDGRCIHRSCIDLAGLSSLT
ncbi:MAG: hypothetical protein WBO45_05710 [Planctomycetota bacterium]